MFEIEPNKSYINNEIQSFSIINRMIKFKGIEIFAMLENNNKNMRVFNMNNFKEYKLNALD